MINSPFEQFTISILYPFHFLGIDLSLTTLTVLILFVISFLIITFQNIKKSYSFIPNNWQYFTEIIYLFIFDLVKEQTGNKGFRYFPHFFTIFFVILLSNLVGLLPFSFTITAQVLITITVSLSYFIAFIIIAVQTLGLSFLRVFCPRNMPAWLIPLLVLVEILSFFLRPFSLAIRLFANMLAGHILLHILAGAFIFLYSISTLLIVPIFFVLAAVGILELGISFLQAYIFTILLAIYLKDSLISH